MQLHVDRGEQRRRARVVAHQQDQVDKRVRSKQSFGRGEGLRRNLVVAPELAAKLDDDCVRIVKPQGISAMFDDVNDGLRNAWLQASGSWATHSNWLSISRAVARIAISRVRAVKPASKRGIGG